MNARIKEMYRAIIHKSLKEKTFMDEEILIEELSNMIVDECAKFIIEFYPHSRYQAFALRRHFGLDFRGLSTEETAE